MKKIIREIIFGRSTFINGMLALFIVSLIALGCNCNNKDFNLGTNKNTSSTPDQKDDNSNKEDLKDSNSNEIMMDSNSKEDKKDSDSDEDVDVQELVKGTISDFDEAAANEDFSNFYENNVSELLKKQTSLKKFQESFKIFIDNKMGLKTAISPLKADFDSPPKEGTFSGKKSLEAKGSYQTTPRKLNFDLKYVKEDGKWMIYGININTY